VSSAIYDYVSEYYNEEPNSISPTIKQVKGWKFSKEEEFSFRIDFSLFSCSRNWSMGSVMASGFEVYICFGKYNFDYLNRYIITPPLIIL
jgi:hypothetical protein